MQSAELSGSKQSLVRMPAVLGRKDESIHVAAAATTWRGKYVTLSPIRPEPLPARATRSDAAATDPSRLWPLPTRTMRIGLRSSVDVPFESGTSWLGSCPLPSENAIPCSGWLSRASLAPPPWTRCPYDAYPSAIDAGTTLTAIATVIR